MKKLLTYFILPVIILGLAFLLYRSINEPVKFQKELKQRSNVAIERLRISVPSSPLSRTLTVITHR